MKTAEADKKEVEESRKPFMISVMEVLEKNYGDSEFGVQELADAMNMNRGALSKKLNAEVGVPTAQALSVTIVWMLRRN